MQRNNLGNGLPHDRVSAQIIRQARLLEEKVEFSVVFAAMGSKHDVAEFFIRNFRESGALARAVMFFSLADAPSVERLLTPRVALTLAEHLAFDCGQHVLVLLPEGTKLDSREDRMVYAVSMTHLRLVRLRGGSHVAAGQHRVPMSERREFIVEISFLKWVR